MNIVIGATGAISSSLLPGWATYLRVVNGWECTFILTDAARQFVSPTALSIISGKESFVGNTYIEDGSPVHKLLGDWADIFAVCPCSLNTWAKLSVGLADNVVTATAQYFKGPRLIYPCFDKRILSSPRNILYRDSLKREGWIIPSVRNQGVEVADGSQTHEHGFPMIQEFITHVEESVSSRYDA